ncbi:T9SS type A sorting domain-containing protein [Dyadobacter luticola]|uniref:T9SS type A sorting domain-containing protein n=1 Tax=Dyadobacter luticola TaxID=1979387 RepID=A0A5R9KXP3_9BACT|nr:T9SS type A sorting domain-containing protein [Dyadobacter luticola]TLV01034.1 T9SS type A sorting domain-containing protein [Dyadobacter luticola]
MKIFTLLVSLFLLNLGVSYGAGPATGTDCGCKDSDNSLKNGGFESGTDFWQKTNGTSFGTDTEYSECGSHNGLMTNAGTVYQEVNVTEGSKVILSVYGGTHNKSFKHTFKLTFYNSSGQLIPITEDAFNTVDMDYQVYETHHLKQFDLSATAPAGAAKVRFSLISSGNYFKVDVACMSISTPSTPCTACAESETVVKNASFEKGTADWSKGNNTYFTTLGKSYACGENVGKIDGAGVVFQEITAAIGSTIQVSAYGATNNDGRTNQFLLVFLNSSGQALSGGASAEVDKNVSGGLQQYSLPPTVVPAGTAKIYFGMNSTGDKFYFDAICMSITPPAQCETCDNNRLTNAGFESGASGWNSEGDFTVSGDAKNCGNSGAKLTGAGKFWQDIIFQSSWGSQISLNFWSAKLSGDGQKFEIFFFDSSNKQLGKLEKLVTKVWANAPVGLEKYMLAGNIPEGTKVIRIQGSELSGEMRADGLCLTVTGSPLPVTLASFEVSKEGSTAQLRWATTYESNSAYFDIQHSQDGKNWTKLATIDAQGESKSLITYNYTHTSPFAVNLYRLKMVDLDETFAYSAIKSLNFSGDEEMKIYPNPTSDRIKLSTMQQVANVKIYNQLGVLVMDTLPDSSNEVNLTKLAQGTYFVKINNGTSVRKILVIR